MRSHAYAHVCLIFATAVLLPGPPRALAEVTGTGQPIDKNEMPGYCRNLAVEMFAVKATKVKLKKLVEGKDAFSVEGAADQGANGKRDFLCTFDAEGRFVEMAVEHAGE